MEQKYAAFISYRHNPLDMAAAIKIQQQLERFVIPKKLQKDGNRKLGIIFRDEDELNISSDLSEALCEALDNSEFLIIICTPEYKQSNWCRQEISYFLKNHDSSRVLPILASGSPQDSFPDELLVSRYVDGKQIISEPLAANVVAETAEQVEKNISREYLRIVARMLDCNYGELVQRQRQYELKRRLAVSASILTILLSFIGMLLYKNHQINEQYRVSRQNEARNLVTLALDQYQKGNREAAISYATAVMPQENEKGPVVPEQIYALSEIVNAYNISFVPAKTISVSGNSNIWIADDFSMMSTYTYDGLEIYSLPEKELLYSLTPANLRAMDQDIHFLADHFRCLEHLDGPRFLLATDEAIHCISIDDPDYVEKIYKTDNYINKIVVRNGKVAISESTLINVVDIKTKEVIYSKDISADLKDPDVEYMVNDIDLNDEGNILAIAVDYNHKTISDNQWYTDDVQRNQKEEEFFKEYKPYGLLMIDIDSDRMEVFSSDRTESVIIRNNLIVAEHYIYPDAVILTSPYGNIAARSYYAAAYSFNGDKVFVSNLITAESSDSFGLNYGTASFNGSKREMYLLWIRNMAAAIDAETYDILFFDTFHSDVAYVGTYHDYNVDLVLSNGSIQHMVMVDGTISRSNRMKLNQTVYNAYAYEGSYYLIPYDSDTLIYCKEERWDGYKQLETDNVRLSDMLIADIQYEQTKSGSYRLVKYKKTDDIYDSDVYFNGFEIYETLSDEVVFDYVTENTINYVALSDDAKIITVVEHSEENTEVLCFSLKDGKLINQYKGDRIETSRYSRIMGMSQDKKSLLWLEGTNDVFYIWDLSKEKIELTEHKAKSISHSPVLTADDNYLVWLSRKDSYEFNLVVYDIANDKEEPSGFPEDVTADLFTTLLPVKDSLVVMSTEDKQIEVIDVSKLTILKPFESYKHDKVSYLKALDKLVVLNSGIIELYDFEERKLLSSLETDSRPYTIITDDYSNMFAAFTDLLHTSTNDDGWSLRSSYLISAEDGKLSVVFHIRPYTRSTYISPSGKEIAIRNSDNKSFSYDHFLSFEQLLEKAQSLME